MWSSKWNWNHNYCTISLQKWCELTWFEQRDTSTKWSRWWLWYSTCSLQSQVLFEQRGKVLQLRSRSSIFPLFGESERSPKVFVWADTTLSWKVVNWWYFLAMTGYCAWNAHNTLFLEAAIAHHACHVDNGTCCRGACWRLSETFSKSDPRLAREWMLWVKRGGFLMYFYVLPCVHPTFFSSAKSLLFELMTTRNE